MQDNLSLKIQTFTHDLEKLVTKQAEWFPQIQHLMKNLKEAAKDPVKNLGNLKQLTNNLSDWTKRERYASPNDTITVTCPVTNIDIYNMDKENNTFYLDSHGTCRMTGQDYHFTALDVPEGEVTCDPWPVRYYGYVSKHWQETNSPL